MQAATPSAAWTPGFSSAHYPPATHVIDHHGHLHRGATPMRQPADPAFEALVTMLAPAQYQQAAPQQHSPIAVEAPGGIPQNFPSFVHDQALHTIMNQNSHNVATDGGGTVFTQLAPDALDADTLAMWSAAPSSFS